VIKEVEKAIIIIIGRKRHSSSVIIDCFNYRGLENGRAGRHTRVKRRKFFTNRIIVNCFNNRWNNGGTGRNTRV
jgi:hypothetical protein